MALRNLIILLFLASSAFACGPDILKNPLARHAQHFVPVGDVMLLAHTRRSAPRRAERTSPIVPDSKIAWNASALLHEAGLIQAKVAVDRQVVTLTGRVPDGFAADEAEQLVGRVRGVQRIDNRLSF